MDEGHRVFRIHFCSGDVAYWGWRPAFNYRGGLDALPDRLHAIYQRHGITDLVLFGDRRPVHRPAIECAKSYGIRTHVFEEGYFRPYWVTLEREGVNAHSLLPRDPDWFRTVGQSLPEPDVVRFYSPFWQRATHDVVYHLAGLLNPLLFPRYRTHTMPAPLEYFGYIRRFSRLRLIRAHEQARVHAFLASDHPYFVLPLQLNTDAQIRDHSHFRDMGEVIEHVVASFAQHAPAECHLVIKNHPLDPGWMPYARIVRDRARHYSLVGRVHFFEDCDLIALLQHAQGCVTVNSTAGLVALAQGTPTLSLSDPIYNLPGLTMQCHLDDFWRAPLAPDEEFFACFRRVVIHATQINGGFYCPVGIRLAVKNAHHALTGEQSPLERLL